LIRRTYSSGEIPSSAANLTTSPKRGRPFFCRPVRVSTGRHQNFIDPCPFVPLSLNMISNRHKPWTESCGGPRRA
jgi:hypothetical protein